MLIQARPRGTTASSSYAGLHCSSRTSHHHCPSCRIPHRMRNRERLFSACSILAGFVCAIACILLTCFNDMAFPQASTFCFSNTTRPTLVSII